MDQLNADPAFVARKLASDEARRLADEQYARDEAPVVADLHAAGVQVRSVWDMVNSKASFAAAMPILLEHLRRPYPVAVREGIARAMGEPAARFAWPELKSMFEQEQNQRVKDGLAVALANSAGPDEFEDLLGLVGNRDLGPARVLLLSAIDRSRDPRVQNVLEELKADEAIRPGVMDLLKKRSRRKPKKPQGQAG